MPITSSSQGIKAIKLTAGTTQVLEGINEANEVSFIFPDPTTDIQITEISTSTASLNGTVPLGRLVFNPSMVSTGKITKDFVLDKFSITETAVIGYFISGDHNAIQVNKNCILLLRGRKDWKEYV